MRLNVVLHLRHPRVAHLGLHGLCLRIKHGPRPLARSRWQRFSSFLLCHLFFKLLVRLSYALDDVQIFELASSTDLVEGVLSGALPLLILLIQVFHHHERLQFIGNALPSVDQGTGRDLPIGAHPFEIQDESLICLADGPESGDSSYSPDFVLYDLNLFLLAVNLGLSTLQ